MLLSIVLRVSRLSTDWPSEISASINPPQCSSHNNRIESSQVKPTIELNHQYSTDRQRLRQHEEGREGQRTRPFIVAIDRLEYDFNSIRTSSADRIRLIQSTRPSLIASINSARWQSSQTDILCNYTIATVASDGCFRKLSELPKTFCRN